MTVIRQDVVEELFLAMASADGPLALGAVAVEVCGGGPRSASPPPHPSFDHFYLTTV